MRFDMTRDLEQLRDRGTLSLFKCDCPGYLTDGKQRDVIHVGDCVAVVEWMLNKVFLADVYNIGTGKAQHWLEARTSIFAAPDQKPSIEFVDLPANLIERYQHFTKANMIKRRAISALVLTPGLCAGVRQTYRYLTAETQ